MSQIRLPVRFIGHDPAFGLCPDVQRPPDARAGRVEPAPPRISGLGDLVAVVAEPIKRMLPESWTRNCGCAERRERLNRAVPFHR